MKNILDELKKIAVEATAEGVKKIGTGLNELGNAIAEDLAKMGDNHNSVRKSEPIPIKVEAKKTDSLCEHGETKEGCCIYTTCKNNFKNQKATHGRS